MCTLIGHAHAEPVTLHDHPLAAILAQVRVRIKARGLSFKDGDKCLDVARSAYNNRRSVAFCTAEGQRRADKLAGTHRHHDWRHDGPGAAA